MAGLRFLNESSPVSQLRSLNQQAAAFLIYVPRTTDFLFYLFSINEPFKDVKVSMM